MEFFDRVESQSSLARKEAHVPALFLYGHTIQFTLPSTAQSYADSLRSTPKVSTVTWSPSCTSLQSLVTDCSGPCSQAKDLHDQQLSETMVKMIRFPLVLESHSCSWRPRACFEPIPTELGNEEANLRKEIDLEDDQTIDMLLRNSW